MYPCEGHAAFSKTVTRIVIQVACLYFMCKFQFFHIKPGIISGLYFVKVGGIKVSKVKKRDTEVNTNKA
jgi:hypothetical protein